MTAPDWPADALYPSEPWQIADETTAQERIALLDRIANDYAAHPAVRAAVEATRRLCRARGVDPTAQGGAVLAAALLGVVQGCGYVADPPGEWFERPTLTLREGGDCEDLAALFVTLARAAGLRAEVRWLDQPDAPLNHVSAQWWNGAAWEWAEPSLSGARLGEHPYDAAARLAGTKIIGR